MISAIVAMSENRVIGRENGLPWRIPEDLKFFKEKTKGHICIMGRKTFESIGSKPLPGRLNIVVSRNRTIDVPGVPTFQNVDDAIAYAKSQARQWGDEIFICGGGEIYKQTLDLTDRIYLTQIHQRVEGDTYFPEWKSGAFREVERSERQEPVRFSFITLERVKF